MRGWAAWPPVIYLVVFLVVPSGLVASYSFRQRDFAGAVTSVVSIEGWREATGSYALPILGRSLILAATATAVCLAIGYPCALALARLPKETRRTWVVLISFPLVTSQLLRIYGWLNLLPLGWRGTPCTVGLVMATAYLPFMVLPLLRACERLDPQLFHAAQDLGATPWRAFWRVTWPLTRPGVLAGCALVYIPASGEYLIPHFVGEGKVMVLGTLIVEQFMERRNWPFASAAAVVLLGVIALPLLASTLGRGPRTDREPIGGGER
jgi:ABC-type spermidine/putrescine transport system permease subunit I